MLGIALSQSLHILISVLDAGASTLLLLLQPAEDRNPHLASYAG